MPPDTHVFDIDSPKASYHPPPHACVRCPRLVAFLDESRARHPDWFNGPVPSFGGLDARLLVVGLAPGLRGANRTGRPFTGDFAGDVLYPTLIKFNLATGHYGACPSDGLQLKNVRISNAVRCVPPENKPTPSEQKNCRSFLEAEIASMTNLKAILALGRIAHDAVLSTLGERKSAWPFIHGALHAIPRRPTLVDTYHTSRYNVNTGRLTVTMFEDVVRSILPVMPS